MRKEYIYQTDDEKAQNLFTGMVTAYFDRYIEKYLKRVATRKSREILLDDDETLEEHLEMDETPLEETVFRKTYDYIDSTVLFEALKDLHDIDAKILYLHAVDGYTFKEVADMLDMPLTNVTSRYTRTKEAIKRKVESKK